MSILSNDGWATVGVFLTTQAITLAWTLGTTRSDGRSLRAEMKLRLDDMQADLKALSNVLIELTKFNGRMDVTDERLLAEGKRRDEFQAGISRRVDEMASRFNRWADKQA